MARARMILVSDDQGVVESCKTFANHQGIEVQVFSTMEWQSRTSDSSSVHQTGEVPALASGSGPVESGAKILPFPGSAPDQAQNAGRVQTINELESKAIESAIFEFNGNLTEAAKALGIGRATLYRKVKQYNIDPSLARKKRAA